MLGTAATRIPLSLAPPGAGGSAVPGIEAGSSPRRKLTVASDVTAHHVTEANALENDEEFFDQEQEGSSTSSIPETETSL